MTDREAMTLERQAFEKWCYARFSVPENICAKNGDGTYRITNIQHAWLGWRAAIAHLPRAAEPVAEVIEVLAAEWPRGRKISVIHCKGEMPPVGTKLYTHPSEGARSPEEMARRFHEAYERLAPQFGYTTREETRTFDPESPNGKLMIAVCAAMAKENGNG